MQESRKSNLEKAVPLNSAHCTGSCYVHVPICQRRCKYCDFYSTGQPARSPELTDGLIEELKSRSNELQSPLDTIFIGGGTPSVLDAGSLAKLLKNLGEYADCRTEFSVEVNCNSLDGEKAAVLADCSVNRVSIGVQSFQDAELRTLGRLHDGKMAQNAVETCHKAGIENLSLDLIYGIPGQSMDSWRQNLAMAIDSGIKHISCYCLSYPDGTALARELNSGLLEAAGEQFELDCYNMAIETLAAAGLKHYEISNFAAEGYRCRHNMVYWQNGSYAGLGPSAVSYMGGKRFKNIADMDKWLACVNSNRSGTDIQSVEFLKSRMLMAETVMLGLRMIDGVNLAEFNSRFSCELPHIFPRSIDKCVSAGLLEFSAGNMRLSREALFVSDSVLAEFIDEAGSDGCGQVQS